MKAPEKIYFAPVSPGDIDYSKVTPSKLIDVFEDMRHYKKSHLNLVILFFILELCASYSMDFQADIKKLSQNNKPRWI